MASLDLLYTRPIGPAQPLELVYGDDGLPGGAVGIEATGRITGLRAVLSLRAGVAAVAQGRISGLRLHMAARADINCDRPTVGQTGSTMQEARPLERGAQAAQQQAAPLPAAVQAVAEEASGLRGTLRTAWEQARALRAAAGVTDQQAQPLPAWLRAVLFEDAARLRTGAAARFEPGAQTRVARVQRFEDAARLRDGRRSRFEPAQRLHGAHLGGAGYGRSARLRQGGRFQEAWPPRAGTSSMQPPQPQPPCFSPELPLQLVFAAKAGAGLPLALLYVCGADAAPPPVVVPVRRVYVVVNDAVLVRLPSGDIIPTLRMSMSLDVDSWTWSFSASLPWQALSLVQPVAGDPVEVQATVNDHEFRFVVERISSDRTFNNRSLSVGGRGRAAVLDAPYSPISTFGNVHDRTARQLMDDVLTFNGVPLGWNIDWRITDWTVPGNVWTHQGTYISALTSIAQAPGAYIQPHPTEQTLIVLPRYPSMPHQWGSLPVDYVIPAAVSTREGLEWEDLPTYERVFVSGTSAGVIAQVTRAGLSGELVKPMVTDPLITHADAARQRGIAELSPSGRRTMLTMRTPVFTDAGVITPGKMVQYSEGSTTRLGLVRGVQVDVGLPEIWQSLELESYEL